MDLQTLVYDFYVVVGLRHRAVKAEDVPFVLPQDDLSCLFLTTDAHLAHAVQGMRAKVIELMWGVLLRDVPFILSAEIRHIYDNCSLSPDNPMFFQNNLGDTGLLWFKIYDALVHGKSIPGIPVFTPEEPFNAGQNGGYLLSYTSAMTASRQAGIPLHIVAETVFDKNAGATWGNAYGGAAWKRIASTFGELVAARDIEAAAVVIDQLLALEHNTSTMFNKCHHWTTPTEGHGWIKIALDLKFSATNPMLLVGSCSPGVRDLALSVRDTFSNLDSAKRARLSLDYDGANDPITEDAQIMVNTLSAGSTICLMYKGTLRWFTILKIDASLGTKVFTMKSKGWQEEAGIKNGKPLLINKFTFLAEDVLVSIQETQSATIEAKATNALKQFAEGVYGLVQALFPKTLPDVAFGSLHCENDVYRFRLIRGNKVFRAYMTRVEKDFRVYLSTSPVADYSDKLPYIFFPVASLGKQGDLTVFAKEFMSTAVNHLA